MTNNYGGYQNSPIGLSMEKHPNWKGGRSISGGKYYIIKMPGHPRSDNRGYIKEHILIAEKVLGRHLKDNEVVHHRNGDTFDNRNNNLLICTETYHRWLHSRIRNLLNPQNHLNRKWLLEKYHTKQWSIDKIAMYCHKSYTTIHRSMKRLCVPIRSYSQSAKIRYNRGLKFSKVGLNESNPPWK